VPQISIVVEYEIQEGREQDFTALIKDHARRTLFEEEGCLRFEVLKPVDDDGEPLANRMMVNELYADQTAAAVHFSSPRLSALRASTSAMLVSRRLMKSHVLDDRADENGLAPEELNASNDG
jgi:quinol monooxygenase YgiN